VKKFFVMLLAVAVLFSFAACGESASTGSQTGTATQTSSQSMTATSSSEVAQNETATGSQTGKENGKVVEKGDTVSVFYTGKFENGEVFDSNVGKEPFTFTVGAGQVIPGFDKAVLGMKLGEEKTVTITPEEGYGERDERYVFQYPLDKFPEDIKKNLKVGETLYMNTEQGPIPVKVIAIEGATVTIDANHPLAGKTLVFDIKVVDIKKPGN